MKEPITIGLGMHKSGTTWLQTCLYEHPEIYCPLRGTEYFTKNYSKGIDWYDSQFNQFNHKCKIDFCNEYSISPDVFKRIKQSGKSDRFFIILRNPYDRAISHLIQDIKQGLIPKQAKFSELLLADSKYITRGHYKNLIEEFRIFFEAEQLKVLFFDDLQDKPQEIIADLYHYLQVDTSFVPAFINQKQNEARIPKSLFVEKYQNEIYRKLKSNYWGDKVWWLSKKLGLGKLLRKMNTEKESGYIFPTTEETEKIKALFKEDIEYVKNQFSRNDLNW